MPTNISVLGQHFGSSCLGYRELKLLSILANPNCQTQTCLSYFWFNDLVRSTKATIIEEADYNQNQVVQRKNL